ncbi:MAG: cysteine desulfurase family protein [Tenacibaculum sp.]
MIKVYLDNAATTPILPEVIQLVSQSMESNFGNPSSSHQWGRAAKAALERARKNIANYFNVLASEIVFCSGGTEADNLILQNAVLNLAVKTIITSQIEHHAVLHTIRYLQNIYNIKVIYLNLDSKANFKLEELEAILKNNKTKTLVSLMWVNNEIGNMLNINEVASICKKYRALFHSDTVQAIGYYPIDLQKTPLDFILGSAHKFHGPKGVGFAFIRKGLLVKPLFHGGNQERGIRSSTENLHSILGMEKALEISYNDMTQTQLRLKKLKKYFIKGLKSQFPDIEFNGESESLQNGSFKILNVRLPFASKMTLFQLDLKGIATSGGSACQSGSSKGSHVLEAFLNNSEKEKTSIRFSFSKLNTKKEIDLTLNALKNISI